MLLAFILTAGLAWNLVLSFFILRDYRLLLKVLRWSLSLYLVVFGILAAEVLREGLVVHGHADLHWDVRLAWTTWYVFVAASLLDWRCLLPAAALPLWFLSFPETRTLVDYGLVRLRWLAPVHAPLSWAVASRGGRLLELGLAARDAAHAALDRLVLPVLRPLGAVLDFFAGWVTKQGGFEKLRPATRLTWVPFLERWRGQGLL